MKKLFTFIVFATMMTISANSQIIRPGYRSGTVTNTRPQNNTTNLFNGGHQDAPLGFVLGYINKNWQTDFDGKTYKENLWGEENKRLHGFQLGVTYSPCLPVGLGLDTGLFLEVYISDSKVVHEAGYDDFTESDIYIPLHAMYRIPFNQNSSLMLYAGFGMNIVVSGEYHINEYYSGYSWLGGRPYGGAASYTAAYQAYDEGDWPRSFNFQWELGAKVRFSNFIIGGGYSIGMTNHKFYDGYKTKQNKLNISLGYVMDI